MRFISVAPPPVHVEGPAAIRRAFEHCMASNILGVDTETLGLLKDDKGDKYTNMTDLVVCLTLSPDDDTRYYVAAKDGHHFRGVLESQDVPKALTNVKFDAHRIMNTFGILLQGPWVDTVHLDFMLDEDTRENRHGLKDCMADYFQLPMREYKELFGTIDSRLIVPGHPLWEKWLDYASLDAWASRKLSLFLLEELDQILVWKHHDQEKLSARDRRYTLRNMYFETEEPQLKALYNMERRGFPVSKGRLTAIEASLTAEMDQVAADLTKMVGFPLNPNSGQQVGKYLFEEKGYPGGGKTKTGQWSTDESIITKLATGNLRGELYVPECALITQYKKASKLRGTYATGLSKVIFTDGRVHTTYGATKVTGRLGSSKPNIQNVPRPDNDPHGIRAAVEAELGKVLIVADYSQLEMKIMAFVAWTYGDSTMLDAIKSGLDMHSFTAARMMGITYEEFAQRKKAGDPAAILMRTAAKKVGFGIIYGSTQYGLAETLSEELGKFVSPEEAQEYIDLYLKTFPGVALYMADMKRQAKKLGFVQTVSGRFRRLSQTRSRNKAHRGHAERQSINAPIQGSAADIVKLAMIRVESDTYLREVLGFELLHQVHDELILMGPEENVDEALEIVRGHMENPFLNPLPVDLNVDAQKVRNWAQAKG